MPCAYCGTGAFRSQPLVKSVDHEDGVPGPLLISAAPVAVALSYSAPSFSSRLPASVQFFWDPQQPQHVLVHGVFLLPDAVAALVALPLPAEQPFCVLSHVSGQASVAPLYHPTWVSALNKSYLALSTLTCSFFRSAASRALGLGAADVVELLRLPFEADV